MSKRYLYLNYVEKIAYYLLFTNASNMSNINSKKMEVDVSFLIVSLFKKGQDEISQLCSLSVNMKEIKLSFYNPYT